MWEIERFLEAFTKNGWLMDTYLGKLKGGWYGLCRSMMVIRGRKTEATLARGAFREVCGNKPKMKNITAHKTGQMGTQRGDSGTIRIYITRSN